MGSFYATTCKTDCLQILYTFGKNWISVPNIVHQLTLSLRCNYWKIQNRGDSHDAINSIRRSAAERLQANDVSLLWRHSSRVRSRTLERAYRRPFWRFLGNLNTKMLSAIVWTPKGTSLRHNACFEPSCVKFHARVTSVGESKKKIKLKLKRDALYFTHFVRLFLTADWHKFGVKCLSRGRNQLCKVLS